jgi:hypothetical protein
MVFSEEKRKPAGREQKAFYSSLAANPDHGCQYKVAER